MRSSLVLKIPCMLFLLLAAAPFTLVGCSSKNPAERMPVGDDHLNRLNRSARLVYEKSEYAEAARLYQQALQRARLRNGFAEIVDAHYNLAVTLLQQDDVAGARRQIDAAKAGFQRQDSKFPPAFRLVDAVLLYRADRRDQAWEVTDLILEEKGRAGPEVLGRTHYLRGRISADRGDAAGIQSAITAMGSPDPPDLKADLDELRGYLGLSQQRWADAAVAFDRAAWLQRQLLNYRAMAAATALSAGALERDGRSRAAAIRYFQAGRSAGLRGDREAARDWLTRAANLAEKAGDSETVEEVGKLLSFLENNGGQGGKGQK
ncbi:MAG: hypothetical protein R2940_04675 [Syntrophotaleaceae bacterium]